MSGPVDVLAVMSRIENKVSCSDFWDVSITDLLNARAAVAELIEAVEAAQFNASTAKLNHHQTCVRVRPNHWAGIVSALARVRGPA